MTEIINIFTDGSSTVIKNKSGIRYGGIGVYVPNYLDCNVEESYYGKDVTNQRMELLACIKGINSVYGYMIEKYTCKLWSMVIYTDSMYTINAITEYSPKWILFGWHRCVNKKREVISNLDLIVELYTLYKTLPISFEHVPSHKKQPTKGTHTWNLWYGNNMADKMSRKAMETIRNKKEKNSYIETETETSTDDSWQEDIKTDDS